MISKKQKRRIQNGNHNQVQSRAWKHCNERVHHRKNPPLRRLPNPAAGYKTPAFDLRSNPHVAQDLVAGLEGPSSADLRLRCQGGRSRLNQTGPIRIDAPESVKSIKEK
jgi:hypothetical protein